MLSTHDILKYIMARAIGNTSVIDASLADPVLLQAEADGYVDRMNGQWIARGNIQRGEQRILRHSELSGGGAEVIIGD